MVCQHSVSLSLYVLNPTPRSHKPNQNSSASQFLGCEPPVERHWFKSQGHPFLFDICNTMYCHSTPGRHFRLRPTFAPGLPATAQATPQPFAIFVSDGMSSDKVFFLHRRLKNVRQSLVGMFCLKSRQQEVR